MNTRHQNEMAMKLGIPVDANSNKTAISRKKLSAPMKFLIKRGLIHKNPPNLDQLDYGCGRGTDADELGMDKYDPYWFDEFPTQLYDNITCHYVLNTIPDEYARKCVLINTFGLLKRGGTLYVAIHNRLSELKGWTSLGTWQGYVGDTCQNAGMTLIDYKNGFDMWKLRKANASF